MPNGGGHYETIAQCPRCRSMRVHKRRGFRIFNRWRCRKCHAVFFSPEWQSWYYPHGTQPPKWAIFKNG